MPVNYRQWDNDPQVSQQRGVNTLMQAMQIRQRQDIAKQRTALEQDRLRMQQEQNAWARPYVEAQYQRDAEMHPFEKAYKMAQINSALQPDAPEYDIKKGIKPDGTTAWARIPKSGGPPEWINGMGAPEEAPLVEFTPGEKAYSTEMGKADAGAINNYLDLADTAKRSMIRLKQAEQIFSGIKTGAFKGGELALKRFMTGAGIDLESLGLKNNLGSLEAAQAVSIELAMKQIQNTKGAVSEKEMEMFMDASPELRKTPAGNMMIIAFSQMATQYDIDLANAATQYANRVAQSGGTFSRLGFANSPERKAVQTRFRQNARPLVLRAQQMAKMGGGIPDFSNIRSGQLKSLRDQIAGMPGPNDLMRAPR